MQSLLDNKDTDFAPAFRYDSSHIMKQSTFIEKTGHIVEVMNAAPFVAMVTNSARQIVFGNIELNTLLDLENKDIIGLRPGELLGCVNAHDHPGGCGTGKNCRFCGAVAAVQESIKTGERVSREAGLILERNGNSIGFDVKVTSSPIHLDGEMFLLVFFDDISSLKKRERLERSFFHDIMNTAGGLKNLALYLTEIKGPDVNHAVQLRVDQSSSLIEEIQSQQQLIEAESSTLAVNLLLVETLVMFTEARTAAEALKEAMGKKIISHTQSPSIGILTDLSLLKRVLLNMLKNALEATEPGKDIKFSMIYDSGDVVFKVWNSSVMTEKVKSQVFQRSFSTKGPGRGIGVYSMRLITEQYLKGTVSFESEDGMGTEFAVRIPGNTDI